MLSIFSHLVYLLDDGQIVCLLRYQSQFYNWITLCLYMPALLCPNIIQPGSLNLLQLPYYAFNAYHYTRSRLSKICTRFSILWMGNKVVKNVIKIWNFTTIDDLEHINLGWRADDQTLYINGWWFDCKVFIGRCKNLLFCVIKFTFHLFYGPVDMEIWCFRTEKCILVGKIFGR